MRWWEDIGREGGRPVTDHRQMNDILDSLSNKASPQTQAVWVQIEAVTLKGSFAFQLLITSNPNLFPPLGGQCPPRRSDCWCVYTCSRACVLTRRMFLHVVHGSASLCVCECVCLKACILSYWHVVGDALICCVHNMNATAVFGIIQLSESNTQTRTP